VYNIYYYVMSGCPLNKRSTMLDLIELENRFTPANLIEFNETAHH